MSTLTTAVSSTANSMEECNNITTFCNSNIQIEIDMRIKRKDDKNINLLRDVLIRMRTDTVLLNAVINFRKSFLDLNACLDSIYNTNLNAFTTASGFPTSAVYSIIHTSMIADAFMAATASSITSDNITSTDSTNTDATTT